LNLVHNRLPKYPHRVFDTEFVRQAQGCFEEALAGVKAHAELTGRVRDLRIGLDLATLAYRSEVTRDHLRRGGRLEDYAFKTPLLRQRILDTLDSTKHPYLLGSTPRRQSSGRTEWIPVRDIAWRYASALCEGKDYAPLPERFRSLPPERVIDLLAPQFAGRHFPMFVPDPDAALGLAVARMNPDELPMPIGVYSLATGQVLGEVGVKPADIPGPGYHLYKGPRFTPDERCYIWLTKSWQIQERLETLFDPSKPQQQWDVYISAKLTGPSYPHGKPAEQNGFWVDRMILVSVVGD
jgi:hypothetical protein